MAEDLPQIARPMPPALRLVLLAVAALVAYLPLQELGRAIWPLHVASPILAMMILAALVLALALAILAIFGEGQSWRLPPQAVVVERRLWRRVWETRLTRADLRDVAVRAHFDTDGPYTWSVTLTLRDGRRFESQGFTTPEQARAICDRLRAHLGMAEGSGPV